MGIQISSTINTGSLPKNFSSIGLTTDEQKMVEQLKARDAEVRAHENAHKGAGGQYVMGGITFRYQTGPDGKRYAVEGEVRIVLHVRSLLRSFYDVSIPLLQAGRPSGAIFMHRKSKSNGKAIL